MPPAPPLFAASPCPECGEPATIDLESLPPVHLCRNGHSWRDQPTYIITTRYNVRTQVVDWKDCLAPGGSANPIDVTPGPAALPSKDPSLSTLAVNLERS